MTTTLSLKECESSSESDGDEILKIGSYCYVDCKSVYGVILKNEGWRYTIIDLFEMRERKTFPSSLAKIHKLNDLRKAKRLHKKYIVHQNYGKKLKLQRTDSDDNKIYNQGTTSKCKLFCCRILMIIWTILWILIGATLIYIGICSIKYPLFPIFRHYQYIVVGLGVFIISTVLISFLSCLFCK